MAKALKTIKKSSKAIDWDKTAWVCPKCRKLVVGYPALSRRDNKTNICSACGQREAMEDYRKYNKGR